ncbi:hypothetical protein Acr_07g0007560 [Actinidia rufa]|uniref:Desiccation-related protein PCC13-62 n=1 Tax=Actinidia rufa TaxID=165716 RepID=A0A7J0EX90_9ERIC|nr:hypothetical protein Acr_07g0007560 [Actinidia rufa]
MDTLLIHVLMMILMPSNFIYMSLSQPTCEAPIPPRAIPVAEEDKDMMQFAENLEYLEAEFFLTGALGFGLDIAAPQLVMGGPPPVGARKANLDLVTQNIIKEFGYQEVGHLSFLIARPLLNLSTQNFAKLFDGAFERELVPPFDPYRDSLSYMLGSYVIPYMGLVGYVGTNPRIIGYKTKQLLAGLLGVEAGQDAVIRTYLYERADELVKPYNYTVAEFTVRISELRNKLAMCGIKDEGIVVQPQSGAENRTVSNVLSADSNSLSYERIPAEILRVLYDTGKENIPGGFFPQGANGNIAKGFLNMPR